MNMPNESMNMTIYWRSKKLGATSASENWIFFDMVFLKNIFGTRKISDNKPFTYDKLQIKRSRV